MAQKKANDHTSVHKCKTGSKLLNIFFGSRFHTGSSIQ